MQRNDFAPNHRRDFMKTLSKQTLEFHSLDPSPQFGSIRRGLRGGTLHGKSQARHLSVHGWSDDTS